MNRGFKRLLDVAKNFDIFGKEPKFTVNRKKEKQQSLIGTAFTLAVLITTIIYGSNKYEHLKNRLDTLFSSYVAPN